jgi:hypothetical protein
MPPVKDLTADRPLAPAVAVPSRLGGLGGLARHRMALAVLLLAALSFVEPSAPTYDPTAWTVWGREILHLDLNTVDGPSWKPLPMLVTPIFALAGSHAPDLWLFVARAATLAGVVVVFRLARRLGAGGVGAAAAAVGYALAPWTIRNGYLGNSEGLLVACTLGAVERHLAGHRRLAFVLALGAGLLRPETWPFLGLYGLWLAWRLPSARALVAAGFASLPVLWFLPEWWGSGDPLRAMTRAQEPVPGQPGSAQHPINAVLERFQGMLTPLLWAGLAAFAVLLLLRLLHRRRAGRAVGPASAELGGALALLAVAVALLAEVAVMSSRGGFSGGTRYLVLPAAMFITLSGVGVGWATRGILRGGEPRRAVAAALAVLAATAIVAPTLPDLRRTARLVRYEAVTTDELASAVQRAGGRRRVLACGRPYTGAFEVPKLAWLLHVHTGQVGLEPQRPAVTFHTRSRMPVESLAGRKGARTLAVTRYWTVAGICRRGGGPR